MAKTLILNLGQPELAHLGPPPAQLARMEIDGEAPNDISSIHVIVDASVGKPAHFGLHRVRLLDGQPWEMDEEHLISNISLIIEYREDM